MKNKIVGIVVLMLMATTVVSAANINMKENIRTTSSGDVSHCNNKIESYQPALFDWWNVDQKQTHQDRIGMQLVHPQTQTIAQSFTPTKDTLTAISLYIFKASTPPDPVQITVSIRDNLTGSDLTNKTINTSVVTIGTKDTWVLFDFKDFSITPGSTYFIVCSSNKNALTGVYCWLFAYNDTDRYPKGEGWIKPGVTKDWVTLNQWGFKESDLCFKTYFRKPIDISVPINNEVTLPVSYNVPILSIWEQLFERLPNAFPILRQLLGY
jgi:hypothetical protein